MPRYTPLYGLPALAPTDRGRDIADIDWANAQRIEAILANEGQLPLDADLVSLVTRLNKLDTDSGWITATYRNNWSKGTGEGSADAQFRKRGNRVDLRGDVIRPDRPDVRVSVFPLPVGFRPTSILIQPIGLAAWGADVQVAIDGNVSITATTGRAGGTGYPLTGISFLVD